MGALINDRSRGIGLVVLSSACWAMSGYFINFVVTGSDITVWSLAFWRELVTAVILYIAIRLKKHEDLWVARIDLIWLAVMGAAGMALLHVTWNVSVLLNGMAIATVFQYNAPFFVAIAAWLLWREPLTWRKGLAVILAFVGTVLVSQFDWRTGSALTWNGFLAGLGTAVAFSVLSLFGKKLSGDYKPWTILFYTFGFGTLALFPFQLGKPVPQSYSMQSLVAFIGLILISTIAGYVFYTAGLKRMQSSIAVIVATMEVPFAAVVAFLAFGDRLGKWQVVGGILVILGIALLSIPQKRRITAVNQQRAKGI